MCRGFPKQLQDTNSIYEKVFNVRFSESMCQNINLSGISDNYNIPETCSFKYNDVLVS